MDNQKRVKQSWSIRLGLIQAVVLLGIVTGSMLCAFYLGLVSGQKAGFETAQSINLASVAKLPIPDQYRQEELDTVASQIYAKLSSPESVKVPEEEEPELEAEVVDLKPIETKKVVRPSEEREILTNNSTSNKDLDTNEKKNVIRILSEPPQPKEVREAKEIEKNLVKDNEGKTLGSLIKKVEEKEPEAVETKLPINEPANEELDSRVSVLSSLSNEPLAEVTKKPSDTGGIQVVKGYREENTKASSSNTGTAKVIVKEAVKETKPVQPLAVNKIAETKVEKPKPPSQKSFVKSSLSKGWYAQVAAPGKLDDANALAKKLKESGFPVVIETANIRGQEYYRVLVGPEDEQRYSQTMVQQLKRENYLRGDPFIRRVK